MRVPVRRQPDTRVSERQQDYARPASALDFTPLTGAIDQFRKQLVDEQKQRQKFDANKRLMQEVNELQSDFERRKRDPNISPYSFADTTDEAYRARHEALLDSMYEEGFDVDILEDTAMRLGTVRQGFFENGLGHQLGALRSRAFTEVDEYGVSLSQYVASNPDGYASAVEELRESVFSMPDLLETEKQAKFDEQLAIIRNGGGKGLAMQNPGLVIELLDPQGLTAPVATTPAGGAYENVRGWQSVATTVASQLGLDPTEVAAVMSFESGGTFDPTKMGGAGNNYMGLIQFGPEERRTYGIDENSTPQEWTSAILGFMQDRGFRKGMGLEDFYSTILTGGPGRYDRQDANGTSVRNAIPRILAEHRPRAASWLAQGIQVVDPGAPSTAVAPDLSTLTPSENAPGDPVPAQTGNALLDDMTGPERLQVLGWAREQQNKQTASLKASMDVAIQNAVASISTGEYAGPQLTEEQVLQVYGPLEGPQKWAEYEGSLQTGQVVQRIKTLNPAEMQREIDRLAPDPASETYATDVKLWEAAKQARDSVLSQREEDPAAYAMSVFPDVAEAAEQGTAEYYAALDRAYERLDIDPRYAPPLPAQAMERATQDYKTMTPMQRRKYIQHNFSAMGEDRFKQFVQGMKGTTAVDDARIYALMRNYRGAPGEWEGVYQSVLEGREMIAQDRAKRPNAQVIMEGFRSEAFAAINNLNPQASRAIQEAAIALYVFNGGHPTDFDDDLYRESLQTALGGSPPWNDTKGEVGDYTILPPKISATQFDNWRDGLNADDLTRLSVERTPPLYGDFKTPVLLEDIIDEGVFVMVSPGRYIIKMASDGKPLMTSSRRPFRVNIDTRTVRGR